MVHFTQAPSLKRVVQWSCFVTTKKYPTKNCDEDKTLEHLLLDCYRTVEIRLRTMEIGYDVNINVKAIKYGLFKEKNG